MRKILICTSAVFGLMLAAGVSAKAQNAGDAAKGKEVFEQCSVCHNSDTDEKKVGPSLKGLFKREKLVNGKPVNEENVRALINAGGNGMPAYDEILSAEDKDNVIAFLKTL